MAVDTVHPFFEMNVHVVHRDAVAAFAAASFLIERRVHRPLKLLCRDFVNGFASIVEQGAFAIFLVNGPEEPAVAVKVGKLRVPELRVQVGAVGQEFRIGPQPTGGGLVGVGQLRLHELLCGRIPLSGRVQQRAVRLLVPPHVAQVTVENVGPRVHVADDALAARNGSREAVLDRMAGLVLGNRRIARLTQTAIAGNPVGPGIHGRPVVGVDDVTRRAAARAVIARVVVGPQKIERRIQQPRLLEADETGVGAVFGSQPPVAQSRSRPAIVLETLRYAHLRPKAAAALEYAKDIAPAG